MKFIYCFLLNLFHFRLSIYCIYYLYCLFVCCPILEERYSLFSYFCSKTRWNQHRLWVLVSGGSNEYSGLDNGGTAIIFHTGKMQNSYTSILRAKVRKLSQFVSDTVLSILIAIRGGSVVERRTPGREVQDSNPTTAV